MLFDGRGWIALLIYGLTVLLFGLKIGIHRDILPFFEVFQWRCIFVHRHAVRIRSEQQSKRGLFRLGDADDGFRGQQGFQSERFGMAFRHRLLEEKRDARETNQSVRGLGHGGRRYAASAS